MPRSQTGEPLKRCRSAGRHGNIAPRTPPSAHPQRFSSQSVSVRGRSLAAQAEPAFSRVCARGAVLGPAPPRALPDARLRRDIHVRAYFTRTPLFDCRSVCFRGARGVWGCTGGGGAIRCGRERKARFNRVLLVGGPRVRAWPGAADRAATRGQARGLSQAQAARERRRALARDGLWSEKRRAQEHKAHERADASSQLRTASRERCRKCSARWVTHCVWTRASVGAHVIDGARAHVFGQGPAWRTRDQRRTSTKARSHGARLREQSTTAPTHSSCSTRSGPTTSRPSSPAASPSTRPTRSR